MTKVSSKKNFTILTEFVPQEQSYSYTDRRKREKYKRTKLKKLVNVKKLQDLKYNNYAHHMLSVWSEILCTSTFPANRLG